MKNLMKGPGWNQMLFSLQSFFVDLSQTTGPDLTYFGQQLFNLHWHGVKHPVLGGVVQQWGCVWPWWGKSKEWKLIRKSIYTNTFILEKEQFLKVLCVLY